MKLSEAIRLGAMLKPQAFGFSTGRETTCALQAADDALGLTRLGCMAKFADLMCVSDIVCPCCQLPGSFAQVVAIHLNDHHRWTRERIADWVATIEAQHPELVAPVEVLAEVRRVAEPALKGGE